MKTIVCIGDSLTEGADLPVGHAWPSLVANALGADVVNRGIGGDTSQGVLSRLYPEVIDRKPGFVFIMGGTNDLWWGWEVKIILGNLFSAVFQARHHGITPVIGLPTPVDRPAAEKGGFAPPSGGYDRFVEKLSRLVRQLSAVARESDVPVADFHAPFFLENGAVDGGLFLEDGLHPNPKGHVIMAEKAAALFREAFKF
jgi:lysophospholipase L1-like esterase